MDLRTSLLTLALSAACAVSSSMVFAQDGGKAGEKSGDASANQPADEAAGDADEAAGDADEFEPIPFKGQTNVYYPTPASPTAQAEQVTERARAHIAELERALEQARLGRRILRMNCINRALRNARRWWKTLEQTRARLQAAGEDGARQRILEEIAKAGAAIDRLADTARRCIGDDFIFRPKRDESTGADDASARPTSAPGAGDPAWAALPFERPIYASPFGADQ